ncbi:MAG: dTDP-4-dehydrorhamnose 3,5-epimerase [Sphingorhabdus sp.]|uniref:dTDP-4-dehydrorhamnose 3,5-epimerase n=1 Tax=Sphingorhabdus sp. TaxID=1902408 RepID=UPI0025E7CC9F|nr:dTDP-4-dehydrorhamnose 3,5-epimerase [Sphingorhabdus sp.]MCO4090754.1 dTDP-4-dehydrorhamnose 3,5-epimerase [Sphingorhabdus sp.]
MPVVHLTPQRFADDRGWFTETWNEDRFQKLGVCGEFCQDNQSASLKAGTIRGIHFQRVPHAQAKLVRCIKGRIFDIAVDLRHASPTFKKWVGIELSAERGNQLFVPAGFGHAFLTLEDDCHVAYKVDAYYAPQADGGIRWDDAELAINWPMVSAAPILSDKDASLPSLSHSDFDFPYDGNPLASLST